MSNEAANELQVLYQVLGTAASFNLVSVIVSIATYVLASLALYTFAQRRGIQHAWLAWIPIGNLWIMGSLSDQYQYVVRGAVKNKRKTLMILSIVMAVILVLIIGLAIGSTVKIVTATVSNASEEEIFTSAFGPMMGLFFSFLPLAGVSIAVAVIRLMALYDIYRSSAPENAVLFLVLSIFFTVTEAFFLFFNRQKDTGMVRENPPAYQPPSYLNSPGNGGTWNEAGSQNQDPWNQNPQQ